MSATQPDWEKAHTQWQKANTKLIGFRLNCNQDADIIAYLESTGAPQQELRRLVRQEIQRAQQPQK